MMKKPYRTPRLVVHGDLKRIVQGVLGKGADHGAPEHTKPCWIAEALYGIDDPRTILLRAWLARVHREGHRGWRMVALYIRFGRRAAEVLERSAILSHGFRALFDRLAVKALAALERLRTLHAG